MKGYGLMNLQEKRWISLIGKDQLVGLMPTMAVSILLLNSQMIRAQGRTLRYWILDTITLGLGMTFLPNKKLG